MSLHQTNKDKLRAQKCRHFCFSFDLHNYCPICREAGKGDDPSVTFETPCDICASFTDEQMKKIQHRKRYLKKQKAETSTKDNELESWRGSIREVPFLKISYHIDKNSNNLTLSLPWCYY